MNAFKKLIEKLSHALHRRAGANHPTADISKEVRPGVYYIPKIWRGPATPVPEHIRKHGIPLERLGIKSHQATPTDPD